MKPYCEGPGLIIYHGDCREVLPTIEPVSACLTDPPYGLKFMGKHWDHGVPDSEVWAQVLRVLEIGAPLMAFGGTRTFHRLACAIEDGGFILSDTLCWLHGQGFPKGHAQLKPAWEPITLAWKKGPRVLAIDAGRIGTEPVRHNTAGGLGYASQNRITHGTGTHMQSLGRWPANVLLDEEAAAALDGQSGELTSGTRSGFRNSHKCESVFNRFVGAQMERPSIGDSGGASRFFYCAKADSRERETGNDHPTVKPLDLMRYLCGLICPPTGGTLLDPFMGSGTTLLGGRRFFSRVVGVEIEERYCEIAAKRLRQDVLDLRGSAAELKKSYYDQACPNALDKEQELEQVGLFDAEFP